MDGLILVDKDAGMTSHDVVHEVRKALGEPHAGHAGTLDPGATGLLVVALGRACRLMVFMEDHEKEYAFTIRLGWRTDTDDADGKLLEERDASGVTREAVESALAPFRGTIRQRPPAYSAVKLEGRRAYQEARQGKIVNIPEREVTVHELRIVKFEPARVDCIMRCSKGTYVRSVARDLGDALGVGGSVSALRRTASGPFRVEQAARLGQKPSILPIDAGIGHLPKVDLDVDGNRLFCTGRVLDFKLADLLVRTYHGGRFIGIGEQKDGHLKARLVIP